NFTFNLSRHTLNNAQWLKQLQELLTPHPQVAKRLMVEITETVPAPEYHCIKEFLEAIKALGCQIALDDFGVGYTSFLYLRSLPIDFIKIDAAYIKNIHQDPINQTFVH